MNDCMHALLKNTCTYMRIHSRKRESAFPVT